MKISEIEYEAQRLFGCENCNIRLSKHGASVKAKHFVVAILVNLGYDCNKIMVRYRIRDYVELDRIVRKFDNIVKSDNLSRDMIYFLKQIRQML